MSDGSLKITYDELRREIGRFLGYSRSPNAWSADETQDVADILRGGCRMFYWPNLPDNRRWSFLCHTEEFHLNSGAFNLPDDFVRLCDTITFSENSRGGKLRQVPETEYRAMRDRNALSGKPFYYAIRQRSNDAGYELLFHPVPSDTVSLLYRYEKSPPDLSEDNQYHLGPASFSELLLAACLFTADKKMNKESLPPDGGLYGGMYSVLLQSALEADKAMTVTPSL